MHSQLYSPLLFTVTLFIAAIILHSECEGCSQPVGWMPKPLATRANEAMQIIYGNVIGVHGGKSPGDQEYAVEFQVDCVLKGSPVGSRIINVTEVRIDCVDSNMKTGMAYIVFINVLRDGFGYNRYVTHDINVQAAAQKASNENIQIMTAVPGVATSLCNFVAAATTRPTKPKPTPYAHAAAEAPSHGHGAHKGCVNGTDVGSNDCSGGGNKPMSSCTWLFIAVYLVCVCTQIL